MDTAASRSQLTHAVRAAMDVRGVSELMLASATGIPLPALRDRLAARSPFTLAELTRVAECLETRPSSLLEQTEGPE